VLSRLEGIVVTPDDPAIEVIYIQPEATEGDRCVDFARFAEHVSKHDDRGFGRRVLAKNRRESH